MKLVIDELRKSLKYHTRQMEDNEREIQLKLESIATLRNANGKHHQAIEEIEQAINLIEGGVNNGDHPF